MGATFSFPRAAATANTLVVSATNRRQRALGFATNGLVSRAGSLVSPLIFGTILGISGSPAVFAAAGVLGIACLAAMAARARAGTLGQIESLSRGSFEEAALSSVPGNRVDR